MIRKLISFLTGRRKAQSSKKLNRILGNLEKPLRDLEKLQDNHKATIAENQTLIKQLEDENRTLTQTHDRAAKVHSNLRTLLAIPETTPEQPADNTPNN